VLAARDVGVEVLVAGVAGADAAHAVRAGRRRVQRDADVAAGAAVVRVVGGVEALVDLAVAVVVEAVADLLAAVGGDAGRLAAGPLVAVEEAGQALVVAVAADAGPALVRLGLVAADVAAAAVQRVAVEVEAVVDVAVAVVVETVADLGLAERAVG